MPFWQYAGIFRELKGLSHEELIAKLPDVLETFFGQCGLPLDHRGTMVLCPDDPNTFIAGVSPQIDNIGCSNSSDYSTLTVCAPGDVGDTTIDNTNGDSLPPIVEGGFSGVFCGPVFNDTTISNNFYVDIDNFYFYDNVNFTTKVIDIIAANDGCKVKLSADDTCEFFSEKPKDKEVYDAAEDLAIDYQEVDPGANEHCRWFIDAGVPSSYAKGSIQLLGHAAGGAWKWFNVEECE